MERIKGIIKKILQEYTTENYELTEEDFTRELEMVEINSIQFIKIIVEIENELDIQNYATLNDFVTCVYNKMEENK